MESTIAGDGCFHSYKTQQSSTTWLNGVWNQNEFGVRHGSNGLWIYDTGNTTISGNLDAGTTSNNSIKIHGTGVATAYVLFKTNNDYNSYWDFQNGNHSQAWSNISVKGSSFMLFPHHGNIITHTRNFANWSDDRLKENEIFIENVCETLSELRPQLYDKIIRPKRYGK